MLIQHIFPYNDPVGRRPAQHSSLTESRPTTRTVVSGGGTLDLGRLTLGREPPGTLKRPGLRLQPGVKSVRHVGTGESENTMTYRVRPDQTSHRNW